jgi:hypothetical protein
MIIKMKRIFKIKLDLQKVVADKLMQTKRRVTSGKKNHDSGLIKSLKTETRLHSA